METIWLFKAGTTGVQKRCTKRFVPTAKKNAKSLLNQGETDLFIAKIVIQSVKIAAVKRALFFPGQ
jgi:hypothetical protein